MVKFTESKLKTGEFTYKEFGKFIINMVLLDGNILLVKYKSYAPVPQIKRTKITNEFKNSLLYLIDTGEIDYANLQSLDENEKLVFDNLIRRSGLGLALKYNSSKLIENIDDIIDKFNILKGEIIAGNDNPKIIIDIKEVLMKLVRCKKISQEQADDIMKDL